jgi:hypothetical protein
MLPIGLPGENIYFYTCQNISIANNKWKEVLMSQFFNLPKMFFFATTLALAGCASTYNEMEKWMGHQDTEIISLWGTPSSTYVTQDESKILTWKNYNFNRDKNCTKSFTADKKGIIIAHSDLDCSMPISINFGNNQNSKN